MNDNNNIDFVEYKFISLILPITSLFNDDENDCENKKREKKTIKILNILITLFAMYLAWKCNSNKDMCERVLYTSIAGLFSGLYLVYYLAKTVILKDKSKKKYELFKKNINYSETSDLNTELKLDLNTHKLF